MDCGMDCGVSADCLVHRLGALPVVSRAAQSALTGYEKTKNYNALLSFACSVLETGARAAVLTAAPVYKRYVEPSAISAGGAACKGVDYLEHHYPAIRLTPEQMRERALAYYDTSAIKKGWENVNCRKDEGIKMTRAAYDGALSLMSVAAMTTEAMRITSAAANSSLDLVDAVVERHLQADDDADDGGGAQEASTVARAQHIADKVRSRLVAKSARQVEFFRVTLFLDRRAFNVIAEYLGRTTGWAGDSLASGTAHLRERTVSLGHRLGAQVDHLGVSPAVLLLAWMRVSSSLVSVTTKALLSAVPTGVLPSVCDASLQSSAAYVISLDQSIHEAESLSDVKEDLVGDAKKAVVAVEQVVSDLLDGASRTPPISWLQRTSHEEESTEYDEDFEE